MSEKTVESVNAETVSVPKETLQQMQDTLKAMSGMKDLIESQKNEIDRLKETITNQEARLNNTAAAISGTYIQPAKISSGKWAYLSFTVKVIYKTLLNNMVSEKSVDLEITMPKPCGHLNSVMSEAQGRMIPRAMAEKGIRDYKIVSVDIVEDSMTSEVKPVSFVGKKPYELTDKECQEFAIIYEALPVPVKGSVAPMHTAVANEWAYILHDTERTKPLVVDGKVLNKREQTLDLVDYRGVRQFSPAMEAISPSKFRELAESASQENN